MLTKGSRYQLSKVIITTATFSKPGYDQLKLNHAKLFTHDQWFNEILLSVNSFFLVFILDF